MIHLLPISLAGGIITFVLQRRRQDKPSLATMLVAPQDQLASLQPSQALCARIEAITTEEHLVLSIGLLGLTTVGHLGIPLLRLVAVPGLFYLDLYFIRSAYTEWQKERRIGIAVSDALLATGLLATGQWGADALFATFLLTSHKLKERGQERLLGYLPKTTIPKAVSVNNHPTNAIHGEPHNDARNPATVPSPGDAPLQPAWQRWIDQGSLPIIVLGAASVPFLGINRALAVLLANFGYDYRIMAPLSTLSFLEMSKEQGIQLRDGRALETLLNVDAIVPGDASAATKLAALQLGDDVAIVNPARALAELDSAQRTTALITQLQQQGRVVAYLCMDEVDEAAATQADLVMTSEQTNLPGADLILVGNPLERLQDCFVMRAQVEKNRKRGLYLALIPSLVNLSGLYFFRFGVIAALLVDYGGMVGGVANALAPRLRIVRSGEDHMSAYADS